MKKKFLDAVNRNGKTLKYIGIVVGICLVFWIISIGLGKDNSSAKVENEGVSVEVMEARLDEIANEVVYGARVLADREIAVVPKVAGKVEKVYVKLGDEVKKNQVLFKLDEADLKKNVEALQAQYNAASASANTAYLSYQSALGSRSEMNISQAKASLDSISIQYQDIKTSYENMRLLYEAGAVSKAEFDSVKSGHDQLKISYETTLQSYNLLVNTTDKESKQLAYSQYQQAVAARDAARVQLNNARDMLNDSSVKSPITGVVSTLNVKEEQMLGTGTIPCVVVNMDEISIDVNVSETLITKISEKDEVKVVINSLPDEEFTGTISALSPASTSMSSTYPVKILIDNSDHKINPGMFARVFFFTNHKEGAIVVPREAIITLGDENYLFIVEGGIAKRRDVEVGIDTGKEIEVISGLLEGDKVVIKGQQYITENQKVKILNSEE